MRACWLVVLALFVSGCAAPAMQTTDPADPVGDQAGEPAREDPQARESTLSAAGQSLLQQGREQRLAGEYVQASATLERALRVDGQQPSIWLELGRVRFEEGNLQQAEQMGRKALSLSREGSTIHRQSLQLIDEARFASGN